MTDQQSGVPDDYLTIAGQKRVLESFEQLLAQRAHDEKEIPQQHAQRDEQLQSEYEAERTRLKSQFKADYTQVEKDYKQAKSSAEHEYDNENFIVAREHQEAMDAIVEKFRTGDKAAKEAKVGAQQKAAAEFERNKKEPIAEFNAVKQTCAAQKQAIATLTAEAAETLRLRRIKIPDPAATGGRGQSGLPGCDAQRARRDYTQRASIAGEIHL